MPKNATTAAQEAVEEGLSTVASEAARRFSDSELRSVDSFDAAIALATAEYGEVTDAGDVIGSGFVMLDKKDRLIDETFIILHMSFPQSSTYRDDNGEYGHFVAAMIVTQHNDRFVLIDGGSGIYSQLEEWHLRTGRAGGLIVKGGLRKSEYELPNGTGKGTTFYLNV